MIYVTIVLALLLGIIIGALLVPFVIYLRGRNSGWDDSNIFNTFRVLAHLALHPADFVLMQYPDGKKPFWYLTEDELSEVVDSRPNNKED